VLATDVKFHSEFHSDVMVVVVVVATDVRFRLIVVVVLLVAAAVMGVGMVVVVVEAMEVALDVMVMSGRLIFETVGISVGGMNGNSKQGD
jgi:hypothetical protein